MITLFKKYKYLSALYLVILITSILLSCQQQVHLNLGSSTPQLVVEGQIQTNTPPVVILTTSFSFFSNLSLATLQNSFVHGANVHVSDGTNNIALKEYMVDTGINNQFYFYSVDTANLANIMLGQVNKYYTLTIVYNGITYTSVTKIPQVKGVDSLYFGTPINPTYGDSAQQLFANYTDPDTLGNYVRYFTRINSQSFFAAGIFSDQLVNGKTINNIALYSGFEDTLNANSDSLSFFYPGDTVTLEWCEIDKGVYTFWNTYNFAQVAVGNPFATPINITSNVSNGALGIWAGYGSTFYTMVVPH